ncbi:MAG TPA: hypothetical protein PLJ42_09415 [Chitinophagales bacterium]|jgi:hypothetical protein|nr:hypothetical protein [Chitinophagales bacterium]MBP6154216.1 hypothetical protein [Chitinophagales bacterium]HQV77533.1 hypothetical protein [Chitinophagales bacterium]HQW79642.1 hypothetical protein [Chitinophagales bacterium]
MEQLKELVNIVNKRKISQLEIFDKSLISRKDTLFSKLYDGIANGQIDSDEEAILYLYNTNTIEKNENANYRKLKSRFKSRLLNTLYFIDINNTTENDSSKKSYFECVNRLYLSNILLRYTENRNASIQLIIDAYPTAKKNNFFDILKEYSYKLLVYYGMNGHEKKYNEEYISYQQYALEYELEQQAQIIYTKVMMLVHFTKQNLTQKIVEIKACIHEIEDISKKSKSLVVYFIYIRTQLFFHEILGDNASINKTTDIYLKNYTKRFTSILSDTYLNTIHIYKLKSLFHLRTYADALSLVKEINIKAKGASFLAIKEFEIKCYLNQTQEEKTKDLIHHIQIHPSFKNSTLVLKERWVVYNAFAEFIHHYNTDGNFKFSLSKFANEIPFVSQDKSGFNFAARIVTILFYIGRNDLDNAMQQIDALRVYQSRHLKDDNARRSNLFVKLLSMMEKKSFNYKELKNLSEYEELKNNYAHQSIQEGEIIFYDQLWEMILVLLNKNDMKLIGTLR